MRWTAAFYVSLDAGQSGRRQFEVRHAQSIRQPGNPAARQPGSPHAAWLYYFGVGSVMGAKRAVEASGGKLLYPPMEVPGGEWVFAALDPQGAAFGVAGAKGE